MTCLESKCFFLFFFVVVVCSTLQRKVRFKGKLKSGFVVILTSFVQVWEDVHWTSWRHTPRTQLLKYSAETNEKFKEQEFFFHHCHFRFPGSLVRLQLKHGVFPFSSKLPPFLANAGTFLRLWRQVPRAQRAFPPTHWRVCLQRSAIKK